MVQTAKGAPRRTKRGAIAVIAALAIAAPLALVGSPAHAWGDSTVGPPWSCTGFAHAWSALQLGVSKAKTEESGNFCVTIYAVGAAIRNTNGGWDKRSGIGYAYTESTGVSNPLGGRHNWGANYSNT